jgi:hypothetical protein
MMSFRKAAVLAILAIGLVVVFCNICYLHIHKITLAEITPGSFLAPPASRAEVSSTAVSSHSNSRLLQQMETVEQDIAASLKLLLEAVTFHNQAIYDKYDNESEALERERCQRFLWDYDPNRAIKRRRIFWGSLIADDSWHTLTMAALEYYGVRQSVQAKEGLYHATLELTLCFYIPIDFSHDKFRGKQHYPKHGTKDASICGKLSSAPHAEKSSALGCRNQNTRRLFCSTGRGENKRKEGKTYMEGKSATRLDFGTLEAEWNGTE